MAALTNTQISVTYVGLLKTTGSTVLSSTAQQITDGSGNNSILYLSTAGVGIGGAAASGKELDVTGNVLVTGDLQVDNLNIDGNTISATSGVVTLSNGAIATTQSQNDNSTKIATTAYVDTAIDTADELSEILAIGNTTGATKISVNNTSSGIDFIDNAKARFGTGNDLEIYHDGTDSFIKNNTGLLRIEQNVTDGDIQIKADDGGGSETTYIFCDGSTGKVELSNTGIKKLETTPQGIGITGEVELGDGTANKIQFIGGQGNWRVNISDSANQFVIHSESLAADYFTVIGGGGIKLNAYGSGSKTGTVAKNLAVDSSGNIIETDGGVVDGSGTANDVAMWSDSNTLTDAPIAISSNDATFAGNISVTGTTFLDGDVTVGDTSSAFIGLARAGLNYIAATNASGQLVFRTGGTTAALTLDASQNATFAGDVALGDNKELIFGAASDYKIYHNSTTNVNHISSLIDRQLSLNANNIFLTNQANDSTFLQLSSTVATFGVNVLINKASNPTSLQIGSSLADDPFIVFQTDGNTMSMGIDRSDSNKFVISDNATLGTNNRFTIDTSGNVGIGTTAPDNLLTLQAAAGSMHQRFKEASTTIGFIGGANGIISSHDGKLAIRAESGLVLSSQGNAADVVISSGNATFAGNVSLIKNSSSTGSSASPKILIYNEGAGDSALQLSVSGSIDYYLGVDNSDDTFKIGNASWDSSPFLAINSSGNVGIGVTPEAWSGYSPVLQIGDRSALANYPDDSLTISSNWYYDGANKRIEAGYATRIQLNSANGKMFFETAGTDAADSAITFSTALTILNDGKVGIGNTSPSAKLTIDNSISTSYSTTGYAATPANSMLYLNNTNGGSNTASLINFRTGSGDGVLGFVEGGGTNDADFVIQTDGGSNGIERFRITNAGNVGIGTTSPVVKLAVKSSQEQLTLSEGDSRGATFDYRSSTGNLNIATNGINARTNPQFTLDLNGNVGIGASPTTKLTVNGGYANFTDGTVNIYAGSDGSGGLFGTITNHYQRFVTNNTERMRITSAGGVAIGTTSTQAQLEVKNTADGSTTAPQFLIQGAASSYGAFHFLDSDAYHIFTNSSGRDIEIICDSGGVILGPGDTSWSSNSDENLKENIKPLNNVLDKIKNYRCVEYNFKDDKNKDKKIGFIAQDWQKDFSQVVNKNKQDVLSIKYTETIPVLLKAIQEQQDMIQELKKEIEILKNK